MVGLEEKLKHCEEKLKFLKGKVAARPEDSTDERSEVGGLQPSVPLGTHTGPPQKPTQLILPQQGHREDPWSSSALDGTGHTQGASSVAPLGWNTHPPSSTQPWLSFTDFCQGQEPSGEKSCR